MTFSFYYFWFGPDILMNSYVVIEPELWEKIRKKLFRTKWHKISGLSEWMQKDLRNPGGKFDSMA